MKEMTLSLPNGRLTITALAEGIYRIVLRRCRTQHESMLTRYGIVRTDLGYQDAREENGVLLAGEASAHLEGSCVVLSACGYSLKLDLSKTLDEAHDFEGFSVSVPLADGERLYGLGDESRERLMKRGHTADLWQANVTSYGPIPYVMSSRGWSMMFNTTYRHVYDMGQSSPDEMRVESSKGMLDVYVFLDSSMKGALEKYTRVSGRPVMLPKAAYGLTFVNNEGENARDLLENCMMFRRDKIPCDIMGLEPGWMSTHYDFSTQKKWDPERFYMPYWLPENYYGNWSFIYNLHQMGYKLSLWLCCDYDLSFEEERRLSAARKAQADDAPDADNFEQDTHFESRGKLSMDHITKVDEGWFEHLKKFVDQGACCFKLDGANQIIEHPDRKWGNGMDDEEMHNLYPLLYNKQMSCGFSDYTGRRSMIYSAGGWAGIQRFSATWAGDTGGGPKPLVHMLNHGYSGHVNASCDMDVFSAEGIHFGFFQPWSQLCNWAYWRQPWFLTDDRKSMYRFYAKLRYRLLPYIYAMAHRAACTGYPLMRAMSMAFPGMENADALIYQYMFGDDLLTAAFAREITLPEGQWRDAWTNEAIEGGRTLTVSYPDTVGGALYIREGAIIPTCDVGSFIGQKRVSHIELNLYPGKNARVYELYEDDGTTLGYQNGASATARIEMSAEENGALTVRIHPRQGHYEGMCAERDYAVNIMTRSDAQSVLVNGQPAEFSVRRDGWCAAVESGFISVPVTENGEIITIEVR